MANLASTRVGPSLPQPSAVLQLLKPVTWFPPMWAFACGAVSSGLSLTDHWGLVLAGIVGTLWLRPLMAFGSGTIQLLLTPLRALLS